MKNPRRILLAVAVGLLCYFAVRAALPAETNQWVSATNHTLTFPVAITNCLQDADLYIGVPTWSVCTNWTDSGRCMSTLLWWNGQGKDPNIYTYSEDGIISSNLTLTVTWKGNAQIVLLESIPFAWTNRSYTMETRKVYAK